MNQQDHPNLAEITLPEGIGKFEQLIEGYRFFQILATALELDLFEYLDKNGATMRQDIAANTGFNGMFANPFLNALVSIDLLTKEDGKYANSVITENFLIKGSHYFQADWIKDTAKGRFWGDLSGALKQQFDTVVPASNGPSLGFLDAMAQGSLRGELQAVVGDVIGWDGFKNTQKLLDLGGGHGLYSIALCQQNEQLQGVIFDQPQVTPITERYITQYQMQNRLSVLCGDISTDDFGDGYDIIIVSHLLYKFRNELDSIFNRLVKAINPGGLLVTNHWFCAPGCVPEMGSTYELSKALQSAGHPLCHVDKFSQLFEDNGFSIFSQGQAPTPYGPTTLHLAIKD